MLHQSGGSIRPVSSHYPIRERCVRVQCGRDRLISCPRPEEQTWRFNLVWKPQHKRIWNHFTSNQMSECSWIHFLFQLKNELSKGQQVNLQSPCMWMVWTYYDSKRHKSARNDHSAGNALQYSTVSFLGMELLFMMWTDFGSRQQPEERTATLNWGSGFVSWFLVNGRLSKKCNKYIKYPPFIRTGS